MDHPNGSSVKRVGEVGPPTIRRFWLFVFASVYWDTIWLAGGRVTELCRWGGHGGSDMERYYKTNCKAVPISLVWSWGKPLTFLVFLVRKALPFPFYGPGLVPGDLAVIEVPEEAADTDLLTDMSDHRTQLESLGYVSVLLYTVPTLGRTRGLARAFLSADRTSLGLLLSVRALHMAQVTTSITSVTHDGRTIATSSARLRLPTVPGVDVERLPGAPARLVAEHHVSRASNFPARLLQVSDVVPLIQRQKQRVLDYYTAQGIWVPASESDIERARQ
jgi:hypothetical protein